MAAITFLGQPIPGSISIGQALTAELQGATHFRGAVAWSKVSGLARLEPVLNDFHAQGGTSELIIGIDAQGATWEGLEQSRALFSSAYVFHDPGSRTFHPKCFLITKQAEAVAVVGSGNLTSGGLFTNYEAADLVRLDPGDEDDRAYVTSLSNYLDWFRAQAPACRVIDDTFLAELRAEPRQLVASERESSRRSASRRSRDAGAPSMFGIAVPGLGGAPALPAGVSGDDDDSIPTRRWRPAPLPPPVAGGITTTPPGLGPAGTPGARFFKRLSNNDVSTTGSPGQIIIPMQFIDFFPEMVLEKDDSPTGGPRQLATVFPVRFVDGGFTKDCSARAIYYQPAASHPRPNPEVRFTFRDHEILHRLSAGDVLEFSEDADGFIASRLPKGAHGGNHFGWL